MLMALIPWRCSQERAYVTGLSAANLVVQRLGDGPSAIILDTVSIKIVSLVNTWSSSNIATPYFEKLV